MTTQTENITVPEIPGLYDMSMRDDFFHKLLDSLYDGVYFVDRERRILFWNSGAERLTGYSREEVVGRRCYEEILQHTDGEGCRLCKKKCPLVKTIETGDPSKARVFLLHKDLRRIAVDVHITPLRDEQNQIIGGVEIFRDASAAVALEEAYAIMRTMAHKDHLTNVANRRQMDRVIDDQLALLKRTGIPFTVILSDIDKFKEINDSLGHGAGDQALKLYASLVKKQRRSTDLVARMGGDEFLLLLRQQRRASAVQMAERLRCVVESSRSEWLQGQKLSASFGVTEANLHDTRKTLLQRADKALYEAKSQGRNRVMSI